MNYELAKQLKDAGFPQKLHYGGYERCSHEPKPDKNGVVHIDEFVHGHQSMCPHRVYCPNLSELIEVCGDDFGGLLHGTDGSWTAFKGLLHNLDINSGDKPTPEEAVAKLWLKLNE